jgi:hypothetical protein
MQACRNKIPIIELPPFLPDRLSLGPLSDLSTVAPFLLREREMAYAVSSGFGTRSELVAQNVNLTPDPDIDLHQSTSMLILLPGCINSSLRPVQPDMP